MKQIFYIMNNELTKANIFRCKNINLQKKQVTFFFYPSKPQGFWNELICW